MRSNNMKDVVLVEWSCKVANAKTVRTATVAEVDHVFGEFQQGNSSCSNVLVSWPLPWK